MEQPNIPAEVLERIDLKAKEIYRETKYDPLNPGTVYSQAIECIAKGMRAEYLHSLQQPEKVHPVYRGWDSLKLIGRVAARFKELIAKAWDWVSFYNGWLEGRAEMLYELQEEWDAPEVQAPAGPVWVKAAKGLPVFKSGMIRKAARKNDCFAEMRIDENNVWFGAVGIRKDSPRLSDFLEGWFWLDESPSPRAAADREKKIALAFHKWVVEKDIWWEDEDQYWYKSISISESLHGNYTEYEKVCETDDELYDLFLQSNP